ncbi:hypothetical protein GEMRC1_003710 [Eukaryota sp. GEM-RC1]
MVSAQSFYLNELKTYLHHNSTFSDTIMSGDIQPKVPLISTNTTSPPPKPQFNAACADFGAKLISFAPVKTKHPQNVLSRSQSKYLTASCSSPVILDIELAEEVLLSSLEISSFEFYSGAPSRVHIFSYKTSPNKAASLPFSLEETVAAGWKNLGSFNVSTRHKKSVINLPDHQWSKSIRIAVLDWETNRKFKLCSITSIKAFGCTPLERLRQELVASTLSEEAPLQPVNQVLIDKDLVDAAVTKDSVDDKNGFVSIPVETGEGLLLALSKRVSVLQERYLWYKKNLEVCMSSIEALNSTVVDLVDQENSLLLRLKKVESTVLAQRHHISFLAQKIEEIESERVLNEEVSDIRLVPIVVVFVFFSVLYFFISVSCAKPIDRPARSPSPTETKLIVPAKAPIRHIRARSR